jgi:3-oxoacyl-[acyl-carrier-protein] synthase I
VGLNASATSAAVRASVSAMAEHPFMVDRMGLPMVVCADTALATDLDGVERLLALAVPPAWEALGPLLGRQRVLPEDVRVFLALPEDRPGRSTDLESRMTEWFGTTLANDIQIGEVTCQPSGHAAGIQCIEQAVASIQRGQSRLCLVGGVDSYLEADTLEWLDGQEQLHSESTIWGFCPGEAAGFCLLASPDMATSLDLPTPVEVLSVASASEANRIKTETVCIGEGLSEAFRNTLAELPAECRVSHTICDLNGEPYRGNEYGFAMLRSSGKFDDHADIQTPADCWGDVGAASGPLFVTLAAFAARKRYAPGPFTFVWASSEGGLRATALLRAVTGDRGN